MSYINYVDFPAVPEHLLEATDAIMNKEPVPTITTYDFFQIRAASDELITWCWDNIKGVPFKFKAQYQILGYGVPVHKDKTFPNGTPRTLAFNYLLDAGGNSVRTTMFDDNKRPVESVIIKPFAWYSLKADMYHGVFGLVPNKFRIALTLAPT